MSEFECRYGHYVRFGQDCAECAKAGRFGERAFYMDGLTSRQHAQRERSEELMANREDEEDE